PQEIRRRDRFISLVRSQTLTLTRSLADLRIDTLAIVRAGIRAADAGQLTARALGSVPGTGARLQGQAPVPGTGVRHVIAAGKAADAMATAVVAQDPDARGLIVGVGDAPPVSDRFTRITGGHPIPTPGSEDGGRRALKLASSLGRDDRLLILLSGGASALMALPARGITLDDKQQTTETLLRAGADIHALNTVRKHLSAIKGGHLAASTVAACDVLVISDVVGDDLSVIASGPTVPDASRFDDALGMLR